ncbi:putative RING finger E3 ubiquitin ligase [Golden Marseillevirus]|uniref:putative RING finger E3 ubiquitin ligase n=1 Tax=Golden Marseillevirus TaxID=1720526 RepID=UPI000877A9DB|nr:putative RING finger E3 ubiquitin ligase [Golden Marseillevirus]ALX27506.1 putative RING finger E3 ubiquitin ligase [Golden Marseillevirus]
MQQCQGISSRGSPCKRKTKDGSGLCFSHRPVPQTFSEECAICLSSFSKGTGVVLSCQHRFHKSCLKNLTDAVCPCCRQEIKEEGLLKRREPELLPSEDPLYSFLVAVQEEFGVRVFVVSSQNFRDIFAQ